MSLHKITFRPMQEMEQEIVSSMMLALYEYLGAEKGYMNEQKMAATFHRHSLQKGDVTIQVFEEHSTIIGYALLFHFWSNEYGGMVLNVDELYIKPDYRGKGISTQYLTTLFEHNSEYAAMTLEVLPENKKAYALYKRMGFSERETVVLLKINSTHKKA